MRYNKINHKINPLECEIQTLPFPKRFRCADLLIYSHPPLAPHPRSQTQL